MLLWIRHEKAVPLMSPRFMWAASRELHREVLAAIACGSNIKDVEYLRIAPISRRVDGASVGYVVRISK